MHFKLKLVELSLISALVGSGCGGGGGGSGESPSGFYAGNWSLSLVRVLNDCRADIPTTASAQVVVNQDRDRVVVDSGSLVLTGETNSEDGFSVATTSTNQDGCQTASAYSFKDASDGEANVGLAIAIRCGGSQCTAGYAGTATRLTATARKFVKSGTLEETGILSALSQAVVDGAGESIDREVGGYVEDTAEILAPAK